MQVWTKSWMGERMDGCIDWIPIRLLWLLEYLRCQKIIVTMFSNWKIEVFLVTQSVSESIIRPQYLYQMQLKDVKIMLWSCFFVSNIVYCEKLWGKVSIEEINSFQPNLPPKSVQIYVITFRALDLFANWMKNKHICILYSLRIIFSSGEILYYSRKHDLVLGHSRRRGWQNFEKNETARRYKLMLWIFDLCDSDQSGRKCGVDSQRSCSHFLGS